ncbi:hypothetical protein K1T71_010710 [Dendrolimus kikuchii]|uniref:Uncharacterized protein n=1 Tax=Dendrolimus kikuchii TaxID=765133 RepID=A0ACC1CPV1_9NEOP|nr:hypothetical protein K1T71_010710 [Dendrolimus kikuchii]
MFSVKVGVVTFLFLVFLATIETRIIRPPENQSSVSKATILEGKSTTQESNVRTLGGGTQDASGDDTASTTHIPKIEKSTIIKSQEHRSADDMAMMFHRKSDLNIEESDANILGTYDVLSSGRVRRIRRVTTSTTTILPDINNRAIIIGGYCPRGHTKRGGWCVPDDDY